MYSPFYDKKGNPIKIDKVKYTDLEQLEYCDEGHHLEYKLLLEINEKAQLAKEITSFANCEGGWLIIGIDDKSKTVCPIDKADYSQKIGKIATRISPMPEFESKFLTTPADRNKGVLVIYVYEGRNAPYICNGCIYVRSGSSKEPIKPIPAERSNVEYLVERSKHYQKEFLDFFHRDFFFPYNNVIQMKINYPITTIYLKNKELKKDYRLYKYDSREKVIKFIQEEFGIFEYVQYSIESIILMHKNILPSTNTATFVIELFYDWSLKIYVPLSAYNMDEVDMCKDFFRELSLDDNIIEKFKLINGGEVLNMISCGMIIFENLIKKYRLNHNYAFCIETENATENIMIFSGDAYKEYVKENGVPCALKEKNRTRIVHWKENPRLSVVAIRQWIIEDIIGPTFGFRSVDFYQLWNSELNSGKYD
jgi:hypothetical protein